jgi:glycosyltransferase involved in cell wall biosynthesis
VEGSLDMMNNLSESRGSKLRVLHVTFSTSGGAGKVCLQLSDALNQLGVESKILSLSDSDLAAKPFRHPLQTLSAGADKLLVSRSTSTGHFSLLRGLINHPVLSGDTREFDVIHLHWPAGLISKQEIGRLAAAAPTVLTLHDYWALTGGCHFPGKCAQLSRNCSSCPIARPYFHHQIEQQKMITNRFSQIHFVAPSQNALETAKAAAPWIKFASVIPNPVGERIVESKRSSRPGEVPTFGILASRIEDPRKKISDFVASYSQQVNESPRGAESPKILIGGAGKFSFKTELVSQFGIVDNANVDEFYSKIDALVVPSIDETFSLVTVEAILRHKPVFALKESAQAGIIETFEGGRTFSDMAGLARGVHEFMDDLWLRSERVEELSRQTSPASVAKMYIAVYGQAISRH